MNHWINQCRAWWYRISPVHISSHPGGGRCEQTLLFQGVGLPSIEPFPPWSQIRQTVHHRTLVPTRISCRRTASSHISSLENWAFVCWAHISPNSRASFSLVIPANPAPHDDSRTGPLSLAATLAPTHRARLIVYLYTCTHSLTVNFSLFMFLFFALCVWEG